MTGWILVSSVPVDGHQGFNQREEIFIRKSKEAVINSIFVRLRCACKCSCSSSHLCDGHVKLMCVFSYYLHIEYQNTHSTTNVETLLEWKLRLGLK